MCRTKPYAGGSGDYDSGLASSQGSAASALENYFSEEFFLQPPREGYRVEGENDGRVLYSYDVRGQTKVAFIAADNMRDFDEAEGWGIETWAQCDPSEFPASVTDELGIQVWHDTSGSRIPVAKIESYPGPEHCDWRNITFTLNTESGERQYLRDMTGELRDFLATTFDASSAVPKSAADTGFERDGRRLWLHPDGIAAWRTWSTRRTPKTSNASSVRARGRAHVTRLSASALASRPCSGQSPGSGRLRRPVLDHREVRRDGRRARKARPRQYSFSPSRSQPR